MRGVKPIAAAFALLLSLVLAATAVAVPGSTNLVDFLTDGVGGVDGLNSPQGVAVSDDGKSVYAAALDGDAVSVFSRDAASQRLTFVEAQKDGVGGVDGLDGARDVIVSHDGTSVYAVSGVDNAVVAFSRNATTGALTFIEREKDGVGGVDGLADSRGVTISPDDKTVYATGSSDDAVAVFARDATTGALTFVEREKDGVGGVNGLDAALDLDVAPGGAHVYVASGGDNGVAVFSRNATTGALTFVEAQLDGVGGVDGVDDATDAKVSPDGAHVYVAGSADDAVAVFSRNATTGALTWQSQVKDGVGEIADFNAARDIAFSPDGTRVYVLALLDDALHTFTRNPATGALTVFDAELDGPSGPTFGSPQSVVATGDGLGVYVVASLNDTLAAFSVEQVAPPPPPAPPAAPDTTPPGLALSGKGKQKLAKTIAVEVTCGGEACAVEVGGSLKAGKSKTELKPATASLGANEARALSVKLPGKARRQALHALDDGRKVIAKLNAVATDAASNAATAKLKVSLREP